MLSFDQSWERCFQRRYFHNYHIYRSTRAHQSYYLISYINVIWQRRQKKNMLPNERNTGENRYDASEIFKPNLSIFIREMNGQYYSLFLLYLSSLLFLFNRYYCHLSLFPILLRIYSELVVIYWPFCIIRKTIGRGAMEETTKQRTILFLLNWFFLLCW